MKLLLLILLLFVSKFAFAQDSLQTDTSQNFISYSTKDSVSADSQTPIKKKAVVKKKPKRKKATKSKLKSEPSSVVHKENNTNDGQNEIGSGKPVIIGLVAISILIFIILFLYPSKRKDAQSENDEFLSDYLSRKTLSRRDYYRNVYLKSEAWKRKRYVVFKRDNWRCVYCGSQATQVHHKKYAKRNIGKEPIEWLESVCKNCHESIHS